MQYTAFSLWWQADNFNLAVSGLQINLKLQIIANILLLSLII